MVEEEKNRWAQKSSTGRVWFALRAHRAKVGFLGPTVLHLNP